MGPMTRVQNRQIIICDESYHVRRLVADVLANAGFDRCELVADGAALLERTVEFQPRIVITSSRIPGLSGLEFTRLIRSGYKDVKRTLAIIVMTPTPTQKFLDASRESGVDEMLVRPFTGASLLARVEAVLLRPRRFIESAAYTGPCRRRRMMQDYGGQFRRFTDPLEASNKPLWEAETNRELVRQCVTKISELSLDLTPGDRRKLREIYNAVGETEQLADDVQDQAMADAARSLARYISATGANGALDREVFQTHIDAMQKLGMLGSQQDKERAMLVQGLVAIVDKRLGRANAAA